MSAYVDQEIRPTDIGRKACEQIYREIVRIRTTGDEPQSLLVHPDDFPNLTSLWGIKTHTSHACPRDHALLIAMRTQTKPIPLRSVHPVRYPDTTADEGTPST